MRLLSDALRGIACGAAPSIRPTAATTQPAWILRQAPWFHFSERPDLPASIRHAFRGYPEDMATLFAEHSPLSQADAMPDIPYLIIHGDKDTAVSKSAHSDPMVARMRERRLNVEYMEVPGMGHGGPMPIDVLQRRIEFVGEFLR